MPGKAEGSVDTEQGAARARILVIEARFYKAIADELAAGTMAELDAAGATVERIAVPGCLEIPLALAQVVQAGRFAAGARARLDGCVALGCVIRGETTHYDTVCANANHWLMEIAVRHGLALGNAILTVENEGQALARARGGRDSKGADAARACLALVSNARKLAKERA